MESTPDNVIELGDKIVANGETEKKRLIFFKAVEIVDKQLDHDSRKMIEAAIVGEHTIQRRIELMDTARGLKIAQTWLQNLLMPVEPNANNGKDGNHA